VLGSFYYGYITTTLVGGILAVRFGGKILLLIAVAWTSVLSVITPPVTILGDSAAMISVRVLEGVGQVSGIIITLRPLCTVRPAVRGCDGCLPTPARPKWSAFLSAGT